MGNCSDCEKESKRCYGSAAICHEMPRADEGLIVDAYRVQAGVATEQSKNQAYPLLRMRLYIWVRVTNKHFKRSWSDRVYNQPRFFKSNKVSLTVPSSGIGLNSRIRSSFSLLNLFP